jgi:cytochrome b pre-mRNA-processing protein 3
VFRRFLRRPAEDGGIATALYGVIVAQARVPDFYSVLGVPDTVDGRFEMVALHLFLLLERLERGDERQRETGQQVFDAFCVDMDRSLRELGVGDLSVPKRLKRMVSGYYGRAAAYRPEIQAGDKVGLAQALARNVFAGQDAAGESIRLAAYVLAVADQLSHLPLSDILAGTAIFLDPASFLHERANP